jgi:predicted DNA-binding transcriptional regulator AlpA
MVAFDAAARARWQDLLTERQAFLTTKEVAAYLRSTPETVRYWRYMGTGPPAFKCGRRVLYPQADLEKWINEAQAKVNR